MAEHDLVIRRGTVVDGTGAPARTALDVAVSGGRITAVGPGLDGRGHREVDAEGLLVTPGFRRHPLPLRRPGHLGPAAGPHGLARGHDDGGRQLRGRLRPGPARRHDWLIELMEGVEDIPGSALAEGIDWAWETFPEYLDALAGRVGTIDLGVHVPHGPVRAYVMGERGARNEEPTADDLAAMARIVTEGMRAGALGFSSSRTMLHRALDGEPVPGTYAGAAELLALGRAMAAGGYGVFEVASDLGLGGMEGRYGDDVDWMAQLSIETGMPVTYALVQSDREPEQWRDLLAVTAAAAERGGTWWP